MMARSARSHPDGRSSRSSRPSRPSRPSRSSRSSSVGGFVDARQLEPQETPLSQALHQQELQSGEKGVSPAQVAQQQADHHRKQRRRWWMIALITVVVLVSVVCGVLLFSPAFRVTRSSIRINGISKFIDERDVEEIANTTVGTSLVRVDKKSLERELGHVAAVKSASVSRKLPNRLTIHIVARVPSALLHDKKNKYALVDANGAVISQPTHAVAGVPLIEVASATDGTDRPILRQTLSVLGQLPHSLSTRMAKVSAATRDSVTTVTNDGYTIVWGDSNDMKLKVAIVEHLLGNAQMGANRTIDVTSPTRPVLKK